MNTYRTPPSIHAPAERRVEPVPAPSAFPQADAAGTRHRHRERDFGIGYGNSSGYGVEVHYGDRHADPIFRIV